MPLLPNDCALPHAATTNGSLCLDGDGHSTNLSTSVARGTTNLQSEHPNAARILAWAVGTGVRVALAGIVGISVRVGFGAGGLVAVGASV